MHVMLCAVCIELLNAHKHVLNVFIYFHLCDVIRCATTSESTAPGSEPAAPERAGRGAATAVPALVASVEPAAVTLAWSALQAPPLALQHQTL